MPVKTGEDCVVSIAAENALILERIHISAGSRCHIEIGTIVNLGVKMAIYLADDCSLTVGDGFACTGTVHFNAHEPKLSIRVGKGCMFSGGLIWASDMHSILDLETGARVNRGKSITIGDRVWLGHDAMVLKGVTIGSGSIIGAMSCVRRDVPPNSLVAGNPARVLRTGVEWDSRLLMLPDTMALANRAG